MIPYEELCGALARWRDQRGLVNGPSANPPPPLDNPPLPGERTMVAAAPAFAAGTIETAPPDEGPTAQHEAAPKRTGEVGLDSMDVLDEELV
jgi:hypothetical protein